RLAGLGLVEHWRLLRRCTESTRRLPRRSGGHRVASDATVLPEPLAEGQPGTMHVGRRVPPDKAVVPRLRAIARDVLGAGRIALYEPEFPGVTVQPAARWGGA